MPGTIIMSVGPLSSQFTLNLVNEIAKGPKGHNLVAVGVYDNNPMTRDEVRVQIAKILRKSGIDDISIPIKPQPDPNPQVVDPEYLDVIALRNKVRGRQPEVVLAVIDATYMRQVRYARLFRDLKVALHDLRISAICFTHYVPGDAQRKPFDIDAIDKNDDEPLADMDKNQPDDRRAYDILETYTEPNAQLNRPMVFEAAFMVRTDSPLAGIVSHDKQNELVARSLAGIWLAPLYRIFNPTWDLQVNGLRQPGKKFIGIAVKTQGLQMPRGKGVSGFFHPILRNFRRFIPTELATKLITQLTLDILHDNPVPVLPTGAPVNGQNPQYAQNPQYPQNPQYAQYPQNPPVEVTFTPMTTVEGFRPFGDALYAMPISVNLIVPFRPKDPKFNKISDLVQFRLAHERPWADWQLAQMQANPQAAYSAQYGAQSPYEPGPPTTTPPRPQKEPGFKVQWLSIASGNGVNLSANEGVGTEKGKFYCQVCVLYAIEKKHISPPDGV